MGTSRLGPRSGSGQWQAALPIGNSAITFDENVQMAKPGEVDDRFAIPIARLCRCGSGGWVGFSSNTEASHGTSADINVAEIGTRGRTLTSKDSPAGSECFTPDTSGRHAQ